MQTVLFDTEAEANTQQAADLTHWLAGCGCPEVSANTTAWAIPRQRTDGKWAYEVCPGVDYGARTIVAFDEADYPES